MIIGFMFTTGMHNKVNITYNKLTKQEFDLQAYNNHQEFTEIDFLEFSNLCRAPATS